MSFDHPSLWDAAITEVLAGFYEPDEHGRRKPESLYGSVKMWAHLQRQGFPVAKSTVERLMRRNGWQGVRRQESIRDALEASELELAMDPGPQQHEGPGGPRDHPESDPTGSRPPPAHS